MKLAALAVATVLFVLSAIPSNSYAQPCRGVGLAFFAVAFAV